MITRLWKGIAIAGIWIAISIASIFGNIDEKVFYWGLWGTFWITIA